MKLFDNLKLKYPFKWRQCKKKKWSVEEKNREILSPEDGINSSELVEVLFKNESETLK